MARIHLLSLSAFVIGIVCGIILTKSRLSSNADSLSEAMNVITRRLGQTGYGCSCSPTRLLCIIISTPTSKGAQMRLLSRKLWASYMLVLPSSFKLSVKFIIGTSMLPNNRISDLNKEQSIHHDLVLLDNLEDTYFNLTRKVQLALQWSVKNEKFDFLMKTDDDVIILIHNIIDALRKIGCPGNLYWGKFIRRLPQTKGKYRDAEWGRSCE